MDSTQAQLRTLADSERSSALDPNPDNLRTPPLSPQVATRFKLAGANVSRTDRATAFRQRSFPATSGRGAEDP